MAQKAPSHPVEEQIVPECMGEEREYTEHSRVPEEFEGSREKAREIWSD